MRPRDDTVRGPATMPHPNPLSGSTTAVIERTVHAFGDQFAGSPNVTVDGYALKPGEQTAEALAMLGVDDVAIGLAWLHFVGSLHLDWIGPDPRFPLDHQDGMGWRMEVDVLQQHVAELDDLAYIDQRQVRRRVTFRAIKWGPMSGGYGTPAQPATSSSIETKTVDVEPGGAVGVFWSGVDQGDIDATAMCSKALIDAADDLYAAWHEIELAFKVADAAWDGPRSEAAKFKFAVESDRVAAAGQVVNGWRDYTTELLPEQRKAKSADEQFVKDMRNGFLIDLAITGATLGLGAYWRAGALGARLARTVEETATIQRALRTRFAQRVASLSRAKSELEAFRSVARFTGAAATEGTKGFASTAANNALSGKHIGFTEAWQSYLFAGALATTTSKLGTAITAWAKSKGINLSLVGAPTTAAKAAPGAGITGRVNHDRFVGEALAIGGGVDAAKGATVAALKQRLSRALANDPVFRAKVSEQVRRKLRIEAGDKIDKATFDKAVDAAIDDEAGRRADATAGAAFDQVKKNAVRSYKQDHQTAYGGELPPGGGGLVAHRRGGDIGDGADLGEEVGR